MGLSDFSTNCDVGFRQVVMFQPNCSENFIVSYSAVTTDKKLARTTHSTSAPGGKDYYPSIDELLMTYVRTVKASRGALAN